MAQWSIPIDRLAAKANLSLETVARKATFDLFTAVVRRAPVDTGRFRANFNVSYAAPTMTTTTSTNQSRGTAEAGKALTLPVGGVTYLCNALPYAQKLELGHSRQAPQGMVRLSALEFSRFVEKAAR